VQLGGGARHSHGVAVVVLFDSAAPELLVIVDNGAGPDEPAEATIGHLR